MSSISESDSKSPKLVEAPAVLGQLSEFVATAVGKRMSDLASPLADSEYKNVGKLKSDVTELRTLSEIAVASANLLPPPVLLVKLSESQTFAANHFAQLSELGKLKHVVPGVLCTDSESMSVGKVKYALSGPELEADSESKSVDKLMNDVTGMNSESGMASVESLEAPDAVVQLSETKLLSDP